MKLATAQKVREYWNETDDGEMSTEMLFSLVGEHFGFDNGQVADALYKTRTPEEIASTKSS